MSTNGQRQRRVLLVYPRFARNNLLGFEHMMQFYPGKRAVLPPLGLLEIAAYLRAERPGAFEVRMVDENVRPLADHELGWADVVAVSGMHPQRRRIAEVVEAANRLGKITVVGGPSASICPEYYPAADAVHVGEIGDATARLVEFLHGAAGKPGAQQVFRTEAVTPIEDLPLPALDVIEVNDYFVMPVQFSVGCPYTCEFCDIPIIYGRVARVKSGERITAELRAIYERGYVGTILFVDDNLIANRKALRAMLPALIAWQKERRYPFPIGSEATINLARDPEILAALQEARFTHMFIGVESPDPATLRDISKKQNTQDPIVDSIRVFNSYGIEVIMGMILGFDTDTEETGASVARFIQESAGPIVYFNLLAALPKTPLWERLEAEGRLLPDEGGDALQSEKLLSCLTTNVDMRLGRERVAEMLRESVRSVYSPEAIYARFAWNAENVYGKQILGVPPTRTRAEQAFIIRFTLGALARVLWKIGVRAPYRRHFWRFAARCAALRLRGRMPSLLEVVLRCSTDAHHLIEWSRILLEQGVGIEPTPHERPAAAAPAPPLVPLGRATRPAAPANHR